MSRSDNKKSLWDTLFLCTSLNCIVPIGFPFCLPECVDKLKNTWFHVKLDFFFQKWLALKASSRMEKNLQLIRTGAMTALIKVLPGMVSLSLLVYFC